MTFDIDPGDGRARFSVTDEGDGPPLVVLHPGSSDAGSWSRVATRLAHRFRVLRFERYPYRADPRSSVGTLDAEVADVISICDVVGEPVVLVGHSSGGVVALEAARLAPTRMAGLVLYEPPVAHTEPIGGPALQQARAAIDSGEPGRAMAIFLRDIVRVPAGVVAALPLLWPVWRRLRSRAVGQIADTEAIEALGVGLDRYGGMDLPVLLVAGSLSPAHLRTRSEALTDTLPNAALTVLPRGGHGMHISAPGRLASAITEFVEGAR